MVSFKSLKIIDFLRKEKLPVVDVSLLKRLSNLENPQSLASFIKSLVRYGVLERAERGKYFVKDNLGNDFLTANLIYTPSYISLDTALNFYGLLSQFPVEISSMTTKRKRNKNISGKIFVYYHLDPKLFWGFEKKDEALLALPEKALLDSLYLASKGIKNINIENLDLSLIKKEVFIEFTKGFPPTKIFEKLIKTIVKS